MSEGVLRRPRSCLIYCCREIGRPICCADCRMRAACLDRCLNWPNRCRCAGRSEDEYLAAEKTLLK